MSEQFSPTETRGRARLPFSLRHAAILLGVIAVFLIGGGLFRYWRECRAVAQIEAMGGIVHHWSPFPAWLSAYVGEEPLKLFSEKSLTLLDVDGNLADLDLKRLRSSIDAIPSITKVALGGHAIDDIWLLHLQSLRQVRHVVIEGTDISDDGLRYLSDWKRLETVALGPSTRLTDKSLQHLRDLPMLRAVFVNDNAITDEAVRELETAKPSMNRNRMK